MIRLDAQIVAAIVQHARFCAPEEACGLLAMDGDVARMAYCCTNVDASPYRFTVDPGEVYHAHRHAEAHGWEVGAVFHSHPGGPARPSSTDVDRAPDPGWWYLVLGTDGLRAYRLGDTVEEVEIVVPEEGRPEEGGPG